MASHLVRALCTELADPTPVPATTGPPRRRRPRRYPPPSTDPLICKENDSIGLDVEPEHWVAEAAARVHQHGLAQPLSEADLRAIRAAASGRTGILALAVDSVFCHRGDEGDPPGLPARGS